VPVGPVCSNASAITGARRLRRLELVLARWQQGPILRREVKTLPATRETASECRLACRAEGAADQEAGDRRPSVFRACACRGRPLTSLPSQISPTSMLKMVMLVVITAVDGAPRIEIRTSAFCTAAAIRHLKASQWERERHQDRAARVKAVLNTAGLPVMSNDTHIVPLMWVILRSARKRAMNLALMEIRDRLLLANSAVGEITEKTEEDSRSNRRPIALIGSPACQRSRSQTVGLPSNKCDVVVSYPHSILDKRLECCDDQLNPPREADIRLLTASRPNCGAAVTKRERRVPSVLHQRTKGRI